MKQIRIKAIGQLAISALSILLCAFTRYNHPLASAIFAIVVFLSILWIMTSRLVKKIRAEKSAYAVDHMDQSQKICVFSVCFNENTTIQQTIHHYMQFPANVHMVVYDNYSTDNTYELLMEAQKLFGDRLTIRKLPKKEIFVHPKGLAREHAFQTVDTDFFVDIDADTIIEWEDFRKAISAMISQEIDVLHFARRNDQKPLFTYRLAEVDEWMEMGLKVLRLQPWVFAGSGYIVRQSVVSGFSYHKTAISDDHYLFKKIKERTQRIEYFYTLFAHERAPETFKGFIRQRINWLTHGIPYYLLHEYMAISLGTLLFSLVVSSLFIFQSIFFLVPLGVVSTILAIEISFHSVLLKSSILKTIFYTFIFLFAMIFVFSVIYFYIIFKIIFNANKISFKKNE